MNLHRVGFLAVTFLSVEKFNGRLIDQRKPFCQCVRILCWPHLQSKREKAAMKMNFLHILTSDCQRDSLPIAFLRHDKIRHVLSQRHFPILANRIRISCIKELERFLISWGTVVIVRNQLDMLR